MKDEHQIQKVLNSLKKNRFEAVFAKNKEEAKNTILEIVPLDVMVGIGDSATVRQIGIIDELDKRGTRVVNPFVKELTIDLNQRDTFQRILRKSLDCEIFITSANAVTIDGKIVDIDRVGNRIAGTIFGPKKVILPIGRNKIVSDIDGALNQIRNIIAPAHAKHTKKKVPCVTIGKCVDCDNEDRLCNIIAIVEKKPIMGDITVILIDDDLGLGWDVSWANDRKRMIEAQYKDVTWEFWQKREVGPSKLE